VVAERDSNAMERDTATELAATTVARLDAQQMKHDSELEAMRTQLGQAMVASHENKAKYTVRSCIPLFRGGAEGWRRVQVGWLLGPPAQGVLTASTFQNPLLWSSGTCQTSTPWATEWFLTGAGAL